MRLCFSCCISKVELHGGKGGGGGHGGKGQPNL